MLSLWKVAIGVDDLDPGHGGVHLQAGLVALQSGIVADLGGVDLAVVLALHQGAHKVTQRVVQVLQQQRKKHRHAPATVGLAFCI